MSKLFKIAKFSLLILVGLIVVVVAAGLAYRAQLQHRNAAAIAIRTPTGIDEAMYVEIGGIQQWIQIRGQDRNNPVLLCVHGGPGATWLPLTVLFARWEKDFTVVQWDQRGAGKTLETTGDSIASSMSVERMARDGIEVAEFLQKHLHKSKIILLGHSWGSILGIHMVKQRPDLFWAYVGTGQVGDMPRNEQMSYARVLEKARATNNQEAVAELEQIGSPPYDRIEKVGVQFKWLGTYAVESDRVAQSSLIGRLTFSAPNFSLRDMYNRTRGFAKIPSWELYQEMLAANLPSLGTEFSIPIYFFQGAEDDVTLAALTKEYFDMIRAPHKELVLLEGAGHFAVWTMPNRFLQELVARVRPLAAQP